MRFAHLADCHIGGWREPKLTELTTKAFNLAIDKCLNKQVDFVLISGDLFNTSIPGINHIKNVVTRLKLLKEKNIQCYIIAGSHDFSPSGKTMLDVLEEAGLLINVVKGDENKTKQLGKLVLKFTKDEKTGTKITGMLGKRGMLEKTHYEDLYRKNLEEESGFKIFMFHTSITELKPKELANMESNPISLLPKNFDYYAGGHVHIVDNRSFEGYKNVVYPGPLFPNSFSELEKLKHGGFYFYDNGEMSFEKIELHPVISLEICCDYKTPQDIERELSQMLNKDIKNAIITIRLHGTLESGRLTDINFRQIIEECYARGAYYIMKNTAAVRTKEMESIKIETRSTDQIEEDIIKEHLGQIKVSGMEDELELTKQLLQLLSNERQEGERVADFQDRILEEAMDILGLDE